MRSELLRIPKELQSKEKIRVSIGGLCSIHLSDGLYVFLNEKGIIKPIGGALKTRANNLLDLKARFNFTPEHSIKPNTKATDLRGHISTKKLDEFYEHITTKQDRETIPDREFSEELLSFILPFLPPDFRSPEKINYEYMKKDWRFSPSMKTGEMTFRYEEIFKLNFSHSLEKAIKMAAINNPKIVLLTEKEIRQEFYCGNKISEYCLLMLQPKELVERLTAPIHNSARSINLKIVELLQKSFPFQLTVDDIKRLYKLIPDQQLLKQLEKVIYENRGYLALPQLLKAAAESSILLGLLEDKPANATILKVLGIILLLGASQYEKNRVSQAEDDFRQVFSQVLNQLTYLYRGDLRLMKVGKADDPHLEQFKRKILDPLARAEQIPSNIAENFSAELVTASLLIKKMFDVAFIFGSVIMAFPFITTALHTLNNKISEKKPNSRIPTSVIQTMGSVYEYGLTLASLLSIASNNISLLLAGIASTHTGRQFKDADTILNGSQALSQFREMIDGLTLTLATEETVRKHCLRITESSQEENFILLLNRAESDLRQKNLIQEEVRSPKIFSISDYSVSIGKKVFLENTGLNIASGNVNILSVPNGHGQTSILRALADEIDHSQGKAYLRYRKQNINLHNPDTNSHQFITYIDCKSSQDTTLPLTPDEIKEHKKELTDSNFGLFTKEEIEGFLISPSPQDSDRFFRGRLSIFKAFKQNLPIVLLDDVFNPNLTNYYYKIYKFIKRKAELGFIVLAGTTPDEMKKLKAKRFSFGRIYTHVNNNLESN